MVETFDGTLALTFTGNWYLSTINPHSGTKCLKSCDLDYMDIWDDDLGYVNTAETTVTVDGGVVSFWYRISTMAPKDYFKFYIDNVLQLSAQGEQGWTQSPAYNLSAGTHTLKWVYNLWNGNALEDSVYIDDLSISDNSSLSDINFTADTKREVGWVAESDTQRGVAEGVLTTSDSNRIVSNVDSLFADTSRIVVDPIYCDSLRQVCDSTEFIIDTNRRFVTALTDLKSLTISLQAKTISDTFRAETVHPRTLGLALTGMVLNFPYEFYVEATSDTGDVQTITGMYDCDELLYKPIKYIANDDAKASYIMGVVASAIGKSAVIKIDDFTPASNLSESMPIYRDVLSSLFGWTSNLPNRQVNVFIRGDLIYCIQRGKETATQNIVKNSRPTINRRKLRTITYVPSDSEGSNISITAKPTPFSGTISFGDASCSYAGGYLVQESHSVDGETETTTYGISAGYIHSRVTESSKIKIETSYAYGGARGEELSTVTETTTYKDAPNSPPSVRITRHHALGGGWWATVAELDGETLSTSISHGAPGGKASIFSIDQANLSLGSGYSSNSDDKIPGRATISVDFPISENDTSMLRELKADLLWLHGRTEETVTFDCYDPNVIDFDKTVTWNGNVYYLERNTITKDSKGTKQSIELVRWY